MPTPAANPFQPAVRAAMTAKVMLTGLAGAGKTYTALLAMRELVGDGGRVAVIDTERRTSTLYADEIGFDVSHLGPFGERWNPMQYIDKMIADAQAAEAHGYDGLILDSGSHEWDAILRLVDINNRGGLSGWLVGTPTHDRWVNAMMGLDLHVIITARSNSDFVINEVVRQGKDGKERTVHEPVKVGLKARQREGLDYEVQMVGAIELGTHTMRVEKTRVRMFADAVVDPSRTLEFWREFRDWLATGQDLSSPAQAQQLDELISETKGMAEVGRTIRDEMRFLRDMAGATTIDQLTKEQAQSLIAWTRDRIDGAFAPGDGDEQDVPDDGTDGLGADAPPAAPEAGTPDESGPGEATEGPAPDGPAPLPEGCTGAWFDLDDGGQEIGHPSDAAPCPVHPTLLDSAPEVAPADPPPTSPPGSEPEASPPAPSSSPADAAAAPSASSSEVPYAETPGAARDAEHKAAVEAKVEGPGALDPMTEDQLPQKGRTLWPPDRAVTRFVVLLGWGYGTEPGQITDEVLVHAAQTAYDPTWPTDGATEDELLAAVSRITSAAIDAADQLHPEQPAARELVGLARAVWPDPQPGEPAGDALDEPEDEPGETVRVDPRPAGRRRAKASS